MKKFSKQREAILTCLANTTSHPTAEEVYSDVKRIIPEIGIATVYRNLRNMAAENEILVLHTEDGKEHFDANINPHAHFTCLICNSVSDIFLTAEQAEVLKDICKSRYELNYYGICNSCKNK